MSICCSNLSIGFGWYEFLHKPKPNITPNIKNQILELIAVYINSILYADIIIISDNIPSFFSLFLAFFGAVNCFYHISLISLI